MVVPLLQRVGATKWMPVMFLLMERFAGLDEMIDRDEDIPSNAIQMILASLPQRVTDESIADAFSRMNCFTYRAKSPVSLWNPLEQSFSAFVRAHKEHVRVFQWDSEYPAPELIRAWLLEQVARHA